MKSGEVGLFSQVAGHLAQLGKDYNLIDLGSGDGNKARVLIEAFGEAKVKSYFPVDIQQLELAYAMKVHETARYAVHPTVLGFDNLSARFPLPATNTEANVYIMFGGTYGNFSQTEINTYLSKVLKNSGDRLLVGMPIRDYVSRQSITDSYLNEEYEQISFSVLKQIGFVKDDFTSNEERPESVAQLKWDNNRVVSSFFLQKDKYILGLSLEKGTKFDVISSWKPSLQEFRDALGQSFYVEM
jgi:uncharacterized SAM-dependent methyltransferase